MRRDFSDQDGITLLGTVPISGPGWVITDHVPGVLDALDAAQRQLAQSHALIERILVAASASSHETLAMAAGSIVQAMEAMRTALGAASGDVIRSVEPASDDELLSVVLEQAGSTLRLVLRGELDVSSASVFAEAFVAGATSSPTGIEIDATDLSFIDVAGARVIVAACRGLGRAFPLVVRTDRPLTAMVLELAGLEGECLDLIVPTRIGTHQQLPARLEGGER